MKANTRRNTVRFNLQWAFGFGALICALSPCASAADAFAASVLPCAAETERDKRLDCYDQAVANFTAALPKGAEGRVAAPTAATNQPVIDAAAAPRHLSAKVVTIDYLPDHVIVHLDNSQVWQQVSDTSTQLNLHAGDTVTIDKQMGSYWLSGRKGDGTVQVKQKHVEPAAAAP